MATRCQPGPQPAPPDGAGISPAHARPARSRPGLRAPAYAAGDPRPAALASYCTRIHTTPAPFSALRTGRSTGWRCRSRRPGPLRERGPPLPAHPRAGLLPLLLSPPRPPRHPGRSCRTQIAGRGGLPGQQGPGRPRRAPGTALDLLVPVGHPGHARASLPHHRRADRARPATAARDDPADSQRDRPPGHCRDHPARPRRLPPAALVAWRRYHQHAAQASHYRHQAARDP